MVLKLLHKLDANGKSYEIKEIHNRYPDSNEEDFLKLKYHRGYDALIRNERLYFLCNEIIDAEFTELTNETINELTSSKEI